MFLDVSCSIGDMTGPDGKRLGDRVVKRREELGMRTTKALAQKIGMTPRALGDVERGRRTNYSPGTKARLEIALHWDQGSVDAVLAGGEPTLAPPTIPAVAARADRSEVDARRVIATLNEMGGYIGASLRAQANLFEWVDSRLANAEDRAVHEELGKATAEPLIAATRVFARFTIDFLGDQLEGDNSDVETEAQSPASAEVNKDEKMPEDEGLDDDDLNLPPPEIHHVPATTTVVPDLLEDPEDAGGFGGGPTEGRDVVEDGPDSAAER